jgi:hypothetical protein
METSIENSDDQSSIEGVPPPGANGPDDIEGKAKVSRLATNLLGIVLMGLFLLAGLGLYFLWPTQTKNEAGDLIWSETVGWGSGSIKAEQRMIVLVLLAGMCGSLIHAATSFSNYVGEQKLEKHWLWWYALRPLIGMSVALVFYLVFRAGLLTNTSLEQLNVYGIMTLAALAGLFSDRATLKLKEIFETLFQPKDERTGGLSKRKPEIADDENAKS